MLDKKILFIEDDPKFREAVRYAFSSENYTFFEASSVQEGQELLRQHPEISVILLDLELRGKKGTDLLEQVKDNVHIYRIIVLTAHDSLLAAKDASFYNVFSYIQKSTRAVTQSLKFALEQAFKDIIRVHLHRKMEMFIEFQDLLHSQTSSKDILSKISEHAYELLGGAVCYFQMFDMKKEDFFLTGCQGNIANALSDKRNGNIKELFFVDKLIDVTETVFIENMEQSEVFNNTWQSIQNGAYPKSVQAHFEEAKSAYIVPIVTGIYESYHVDAFFVVISKYTQFFTNERRKLIDEFSRQAYLAIGLQSLKDKKHFLEQEIKNVLKSRTLVFICYPRSNEEEVCLIYDRLKDDGFQPWMDKEDILAGENWEYQIKQALKRSHFCIIFISSELEKESGNAHREIKLALKRQEELPDGTVFIIPATLEKSELPESLNHYQHVNLRTRGGYARLKKTLTIYSKQNP